MRYDKDIVKFVNSCFNLNAESISYIPMNGNHLILEFNDYSIRVVDLGDGIKYGFLLYSILLATYPKIVLIDDVESHLHIHTLSKIVHALLHYSKENNAQIIMTTHSMEFIEKIVRAAVTKKFKPEEIVIIHLLNKGAKIVYRRSDLNEAQNYIFTLGSDLRKP